MPPITILALSDIHGKESSLRSILASTLNSYKIDAISISGDITHFGTFEDLRRMLYILAEAGVPFVYILGNCDPADFKKGIDSPGACIESRSLNIAGITVIGGGGSTPTPFNTPFEIREEDLVQNLKRALAESGDAVTMLITHNPPLGSVVDLTRFGSHVGSKMLRDLIISLSPRVAQCGHIHEAIGKELIGTTTVFNPGPAMRGHYALVIIEGSDVHVQHGRA